MRRLALYYLHKAGWVHRDFSVANVLWVEERNGQVGKLSDFEFAKKVDSEISHDVRTVGIIATFTPYTHD